MFRVCPPLLILVSACDMTHSYLSACDMTYSYLRDTTPLWLWHDSFMQSWHDSFMSVTWLIHICVTWLLHNCEMTHLYLRDMMFSFLCHDSFVSTWHDSSMPGSMTRSCLCDTTSLFISVTWLIHIRATSLLHICDMTRYEWVMSHTKIIPFIMNISIRYRWSYYYTQVRAGTAYYEVATVSRID